MKSIKQIAEECSERERPCNKCEFRPKNALFCAHRDICKAAFRRGFIKGERYGRIK